MVQVEEDPFGFICQYCIYSSSQEDLLNSLFVGEGDDPAPNPPHPSAYVDENSSSICSGSDDDDDGVNSIFICSSHPSTSVDENSSTICSDSDDDDDDDDAVNSIFIFSAPETQLSDSGDEFKTPPEESRRSSSEEAPPHKTYSLHDSAGNRTSTVETDGEDSDGETPDLGFSQGSEMVELLSDVENQVSDEGLENENETNSVEFSDVQQVQEEEGLENENETSNVEFSDVQQVQEEDEVLENENGSKEYAVDYADDLGRQGMPQNGDGDNGEEDDNSEESFALVLELLDLLAEEELQDRLEAKRHGMKFPEPK